MSADPFITFSLTPGAPTFCPTVGASVIDNWTAASERSVLIRGFTATELMAILWNAKKVRFQSSFVWQEWDESGPTYITSGNYSYDDEVTGPGASGTAVQPRERICQSVFFDFAQNRNIPDTSTFTHYLNFDILDILIQGTEWAISADLYVSTNQYRDEQTSTDFTGQTTPPFFVVADVGNVLGTPLSTISASLFGKTVTMKVFENLSYNIRSHMVSLTLSVSESWTY